MAKSKSVVAIDAAVSIEAAASEGNGPARFVATFYTGGELRIAGWDLPVVVDLAGLKTGKVLVANLDHDKTKRVGNFSVANDGKSLVASGTATAATAARDEVVNSAKDGYQWQASLEVYPDKIEEVKAGKKVSVNGQEFTGPIYVTRTGTLKGFAFVSHGADDSTSATIAATAANTKGKVMKAEVKAWVNEMLPSVDVDSLTPEEVANLEANYEGRNGTKKKKVPDDPFESRKLEASRRREIMQFADQQCETYMQAGRVDEIDEIRKLADHAIEKGMSPQDFRLEMYASGVPYATTVRANTREKVINSRIIEAAICEAGRLASLEKHFTDQELQLAHDRFKHGISLCEFLILCAEANGFTGSTGGRVTIDVQRAAFGMSPRGRMVHATGFSTIDVANITGAVANKFIHEGWMSVDQTPLRIAAIRPVRNFQQVTTVSLTGALQFEKLGPAGEVKHGTLDEITYTNQADTYAAMLAITRQDIINDDLGALTAVPRRLGRGGMLKLNDIFWTEFLILETDGFFAAGNNNINTAAADATLAGLAKTESIFLDQTDYDGKPLGIMPKIILAPTALKATFAALLDPQSKMTGGSSNVSDANPFRGRFTLESSPYMSNSSYTGYSAAEWYMLADPNELAVIEIAALNGRIEPQVDTADADFNTLGIQMRGYSDIGVKRQEKKAGVLADGGAS